ncbi:thiamine phosphate synthase [Dactylosporangium sp. AC04546]|uniref:thiamine phosphate synthase n=1 Tax=Dactylosporangium sp. AC04546 TaxID=2862460 RepID=UPI001EDCC720|nr:thiamine phosphate synthase [Dactylosporangium sp. AC04546]WVK82140.1 thiamine phosphate synthase [Dactylosporangium sp. AC04546]
MTPGLIVFTDRRQATRPLDEVVDGALDGGARIFVLREDDLRAAERAALAERLGAMITGAGGRLLLEEGPELRKCHDLGDLVAAATGGVDYATLSPIYPTRSKPGYGPPLGLAGLGRMALAVAIPVYALGGVDSPARVRDCLDQGAAGVAVMGAVMRADDPARFVKELLTA